MNLSPDVSPATRDKINPAAEGRTRVSECRMGADRHMGLGRNVLGHGPDPYEPHAHPFSLVLGLVACCTGDAACRIEGHITSTESGYHHTIGAAS